MAAGFASYSNTFVPSFDASGQLVVNFSRNPADFAINSYVTITPAKKTIGYFLQITAENAARVLQTSIADSIWAPGNDAPTGEWNTESFQFQKFDCNRFAFPFRLDYLAVEQADWQILASHAAMAAQQAMTARTLKVLTKLLDITQYAASHVATATSIGGGFWTAGTSTSPIINKTLNAAIQQIQYDTLGVVRHKDLVLVISPVVADAMARSAEIRDYLKGSPFAWPALKGNENVAPQMGTWGLPDTLYGIKVIVDDTVRVSSHKLAASKTAGYVMDGDTALLIARPGGLVGFEGSASFSTCHVFAHEEMTTETKDDVDNRRTLGRVVENYDVQIVAPASGFVITHVLS